MKILLAIFVALTFGSVCQAQAGSATFTADLTTQYKQPGKGFHFQSGALDNCAGMDMANWDADAAGLPTPISPTPTLNNVLTILGTAVPSGGTLATWQTCFDSIRSFGAMVGLRFLSTGTAAQMAAQIAAMAPVLKQNADVIRYIQAGMCGDSGEWVGGGAACTTSAADKLTIQQAWLGNGGAAPPNIPVEFTQVYPMEVWFGTAPMTAAEAFSGSVRSWTGFHNDCFLTAQGDSSTYPNAGSYGGYTSNTSEQQKRVYAAALSNYQIFGGETCTGSVGANAGTRTGCTDVADNSGLPPNAGAGGILNEGPRYHLSHLNVGYAPPFMAAWSAGGCLQTVIRLMGYRLQLDNLTAPNSIAKGASGTIVINLRNYGWARIHDTRVLRVVALHTNGIDKFYGYSVAQLRQCDPQATSSNCKMNVRIPVPANQLSGTYHLHVWAPSMYSTTEGVRAYMVRFANANSGAQTWDDTNGRMDSGVTMTVP